MSNRDNGMKRLDVGIDAVIDALPAQICILDRHGSIVMTNRAWRVFAQQGGAPASACSFEGQNYLAICAGAAGEDADYAARAAAGIRAVLDGAEPNFRIEYPCDDAAGRKRWFRMVAGPLPDRSGAVVMHTDVTAEYQKARQLERDEHFFRLLFDASPLPTWVFDWKTLAFLAVNDAAVEHYGYSQKEFLGMTIHDIRSSEERARLEAWMKQDLDDGVRRSGFWPHRCRDGTLIDVEIVSRSIEFQQREARLVIARDVTESLRERRVREIEARVLAQISTRHELSTILRTVAAGIEQAAPDTVASILLLDADRRQIHHAAAPSLPDDFTRAIDGLEIGPHVGSCGTAMYRGETVIVDDIRTDPLWHGLAERADELGLRACWSRPVFDTQKNVVGSLALYYREPREPQAWERELVELFASLVGVAIERHRQDEALRISEQRLRKLFREAATGIALLAEDGTVLQANAVLARMLEHSDDELLAQNYHKCVPPEDHVPVRTAMRRLLAGTRKAETLEHRFVGKTGRTVWVRARLSAQTGRDGRPTHVIAIIEDITAQREAEQKLEHARALQRVAGRIGRVGGWAANLEDDEAFWSPEIFNILEWEGDQAPPPSDTLARYLPEHRRRLESALKRCSEEGIPFDLELELTTYGGRRLQVRAAGEAERDPSGRIRRLIGAFQDITEHKRLEDRRQQLADRLESTLANMSDAFVLVDCEWRVVYLNRSAGQLVERSGEQLVGRVLWDEFPELDDTIAGERYRHAMQTGESVHFELYYEPLENWFEVNAYPSAEGLAIYFTTTTEQRKLQAQLEQAQRLESVGQLTGGVAHDFNNLLTVILGNAELLAESLADSGELAPFARSIEQAAMRGAELTQRLLAFARRQPLEPEATDANRLILE
ncbi:MAG: PAS domain S-box protein, partial [Xanthomonadaceae bacterium]|nr:PAS domain S-box protein [Xanthomonadaceae bacterium]